MPERTRTDVECNECGHKWISGMMIKNIEAGNAKCKGEGCECTSIKIIGPAKPIAADPTESAEERTLRLDAARRNRVDDQNTDKAIETEAEEDALADVALTAEERAFCTTIAARMNAGRRQNTPAAADILRYSKLKKRYDVK